MSIHVLEREQLLAADVEEVFDFFSRAHNLEQLTPPWLRFEVITPEPVKMHIGTRIDYRLRLHGIPLRWTSLIEDWVPRRRFVDRQIRGPYKLWHHTHEFEPQRDGTIIRDRVRYEVPLGLFGDLIRVAFVSRDLKRVFEYRHQAAERLLPSSAPTAA